MSGGDLWSRSLMIGSERPSQQQSRVVPALLSFGLDANDRQSRRQTRWHRRSSGGRRRKDLEAHQNAGSAQSSTRSGAVPAAFLRRRG